MAMASTSLTALSSSPMTFPCSSNFLPHFRLQSQRKPARIRTLSADTGRSHRPSSAQKKNPFAVALQVPRNIWRQLLRPLSSFGFGRKSIREGGVGLFLLLITVLLAFSFSWMRGFWMRSKFRKYLAVLEFAQAPGIQTGTPVRIRGIPIGNVIRVNASLKCVEAVVEVGDDKQIIPRNSLIEVNRSGLLMESLIDITPQDPIPTPSAGPLDPGCEEEGLIVCDSQKIEGNQGVSLDVLVGTFTNLGRQVEEIGIARSYALAERAFSAIDEAKPLLIKNKRSEIEQSMFLKSSSSSKIKALVEGVKPLLAEVHDGGVLRELEKLTRSLTEASEELRRVHSSFMTPQNTELVQNSIQTLASTLKNIEKISSDIRGFTGDEALMQNLRELIRSLSRLL